MKLIVNFLICCALTFLFSNVTTAQQQLSLLATFYGENRGDYLGTGLTGGDFNNDGFNDVLIGSGEWKKGNGTGRNYLYFGSQNIDDTVDLVFSGSKHDEYFDYSTSAGDLNNDHHIDTIIPGHGYPNYNGIVRIYYGKDILDTIPDIVLHGQVERQAFGLLVSANGDINGDGYDDIIIRASSNTEIPYNIFIYFGGAPMDTVADLMFYMESLREVIYAGDVNNDGYDDVLIKSEDTPTRLYYGGTEMDTIPDVSFYEGSKIGGVGDVNGDGFDDIVIGFSLGGPEGTFLYFGSTEMDTIPDLTFRKIQNKLVHARDISSGDINGDNYPNVILGQVISFGSGGVYIYTGGPNMDNQPEAVMYSSNFGKGFGTYISGVGDVNGDGADELLVSNTEFLGNQGIVYLFAGDKNLPITGVKQMVNNQIPVEFRLLQNFPNPFNMSTQIRYEFKSDRAQWVQLSIFNQLGKEVNRLVNRKQSSGCYEVNWNSTDQSGRNVSSGVYFCYLKVGDNRAFTKIIVLR